MMKQLTVYVLALLLITGTTAALARGDGHNDGHHGRDQYKHRSHHNGHYQPYRSYRYYNRHYRPNYYYPSYLGAALIGSALTSSLYHNHNGARCYQDHSSGQYSPNSGGNREIVGCHRIEILADGSERRVELPMSQCR